MALNRIEVNYLDVNLNKFWYSQDPYWETVHEGRRSDTRAHMARDDEGDAGHHAICHERKSFIWLVFVPV